MNSKKPIVLDSDGVFATLADGEQINAGGTSSPTWTVNGQGLLFADGSSTSNQPSTLSLQKVYNNSPNSNPLIKLTAGKDFIIADDTDNSIFFSIDSETGKVTITGDFEVLGSSAIINTEVQDSDHWLISPKSGAVSALKIEPDIGVIPFVDLISVRRTFGSAPVFRIDSSGNLIASQNFTLGGLLNGVDIAQLHSDFNNHLSGAQGFRHLAEDVDILPIQTLPNAENVQQALEQLDIKIEQGTTNGNLVGYEHIQTYNSATWNIVHNKNSMRSQVTIYDEDMEQILPEQVKIIDVNNILVSFSTPISGKAMVILF